MRNVSNRPSILTIIRIFIEIPDLRKKKRNLNE